MVIDPIGAPSSNSNQPAASNHVISPIGGNYQYKPSIAPIQKPVQQQVKNPNMLDQLSSLFVKASSVLQPRVDTTPIKPASQKINGIDLGVTPAQPSAGMTMTKPSLVQQQASVKAGMSVTKPLVAADTLVKQKVGSVIDKGVKIGNQASDAVVNQLNQHQTIKGAVTKVWNQFYQNALLSPQEQVLLNTGVLQALPKDSIFTQWAKVNIQTKQEFGKGLIQGIARDTLNWNTRVSTALDTEVKQTPKGMEKVNTVGNLIGQIAPYVFAPEALPERIGAIAIPLVFTTLGQTSLPSTTPGTVRTQHALIDATAGTVFKWLSVPANVLSLKNAGLKSGEMATLTAQVYADARASGANHQEALKQVQDALVFNGGLVAAFTVLGIGKVAVRKTLESQIKTGSDTFDPLAARKLVVDTGLQNTPDGQKIIHDSLVAEEQGKQVKIEMAAAQKSPVSKALGLPTAEGVQLRSSVVDAPLKGELVPERLAAQKLNITVPNTFRSETEKKSVQYVLQHHEELIQQYLKEFPGEINGDNAKTLFTKIGYNKTNVVDFDVAGGMVSKLVYNRLLELHKDDGKLNVLFTAGGPGSGKSTAVAGIKASGKYSFVFDSNLANHDRAKAMIDQAVAAGYSVHVQPVMKDAFKAYTEGVMGRYKEGDPRTVPINTHVHNHNGYVDTVVKLADEFKGSDKVFIDKPISNNGKIEDMASVSIDELKKQVYNKDELTKQLNEHTDKLYNEKQITADQHKALTGREYKNSHGELQKKPQKKVSAEKPSEVTPEKPQPRPTLIKKNNKQLPTTQPTPSIIPTYTQAQKLISKEGGYANASSLPAINRIAADELSSAINLNAKWLYDNATKQGVNLRDWLLRIDSIDNSQEKIQIGNKLLTKLNEPITTQSPEVKAQKKQGFDYQSTQFVLTEPLQPLAQYIQQAKSVEEFTQTHKIAKYISLLTGVEHTVGNYENAQAALDIVKQNGYKDLVDLYNTVTHQKGLLAYDKIEAGESHYYEKLQDSTSGTIDYSATNTELQSDLARDLTKSPIKIIYKKTGIVTFPHQKIHSPADIAFAFHELSKHTTESSYVIGLKNEQIVSVELLSMGSIDANLVDAWEMTDLLHSKNADTVYLLHNHPSGNPSPSDADEQVTRTLAKGLMQSGMILAGHVIVNTKQYGFIDARHNYNTTVLPLEVNLAPDTKVPVFQKYAEWNMEKPQIPKFTRVKDIADFSKGMISNWETNGMIVYMNSRNIVIGIDVLPKDKINPLAIVLGTNKFRARYVITANIGLTDVALRELRNNLAYTGITLIDSLRITPEGIYSHRGANISQTLDQRKEFASETLRYGPKDYLYDKPSSTDQTYDDLIRQLQGLDAVKQAVAPNIEKSTTVHNVLSAKDSTPIGAFESVDKPIPTENPRKLADVVKELTRTYAKLIGEGHTGRKAIGTFHPENFTIRTHGVNDLSVNVHEIAHAIDEKYQISQQVRRITGTTDAGIPIYDRATVTERLQLTKLYKQYYPEGKSSHKLSTRITEGYATLVAKYIEMPKTIIKEYPALVRAFLTPQGRYFTDTMGSFLQDVRHIVDTYQGLDSLDKIGVRVVKKAMQTDKSYLNIADKIRTFMEDEVYPHEKLAQITGTHWTTDDPSLWIRQYARGGGMYANNILNKKEGYWTLNSEGNAHKLLEFNWKNLYDTLNKDKQMDAFGYYLVARDQASEWQELDRLTKIYEDAAVAVENTQLEGKDTTELQAAVDQAAKDVTTQQKYLTNNGFVRSEVETAALENKDRFAIYTSKYDQLVRADLDLLHNPLVGRVDDAKYEELTAKDGYASMKRAFFDDILGDDTGSMIGNGGMITPKFSSLKTRTGGQQQILNPVYNGMTNHVEITKKAFKQIVNNSYGRLAQQNKAPSLMQVIPLETSIDAQGRISFPQEKDQEIVMAFLDYKRVPVLMDRQLKRSLDEVLTHQAMNVFENLFVSASRTFTIGTTAAYAPFSLVNYPADQWTALANTRNHYVPLISQLKTLGDLFNKSDTHTSGLWDEWKIMGGDRMTLFQAEMMAPEDAVKYITEERNGIEKVIAAWNKGVDFASLPSKYSETISRFSEYVLARRAGKHQIVAFEEAGRVTAPFHHIGTWKISTAPSGKYVIRTIPFGNAGLQVLAQTFRTARTTKGRLRLGFVLMAALAAYLSTVAMMSLYGTKDQKDQYKDLQPTDIGTFLYYPDLSGHGLNRVRISQEYTTIGTLISMIYAQQVMGAKYTQQDYTDALTNWVPRQLNITSPVEMFFSLLNPGIKIPIEVLANFKDYPHVTPLENQSVQNLEPKDRVNPQTSVIAKALGSQFNLSPIKLDYLLNGLLGRATGLLSVKPGIYNPLNQIQRDYLFTMGRRAENFYTEKAKVDQQVTSMKAKWGDKTTLPDDIYNQAVTLKAKQKAYSDVATLLKYYRELPENNRPQLERARQIILKRMEAL